MRQYPLTGKQPSETWPAFCRRRQIEVCQQILMQRHFEDLQRRALAAAGEAVHTSPSTPTPDPQRTGLRRPRTAPKLKRKAQRQARKRARR
jgi:hypothetical protein